MADGGGLRVLCPGMHFPTIGKYLTHGDAAYTFKKLFGDEVPTAALLVGELQFKKTLVDMGDSIYLGLSIWQPIFDYLPTTLMKLRCSDKKFGSPWLASSLRKFLAEGLGYGDGVAELFKDSGRLDELDKKIAQAGGCSVVEVM